MKKIFLSLLLVFSIILSSCGPNKIDESFNVKIEGKVLDSYGKVLTNSTVQLWKSDMDLLDDDVYFYWLVANKYPFKTTTTDENGEFKFVLTGKEANNTFNTAAAYFVVSVTNHTSRTSTFSHVFSDKTLDGLYWKMKANPLKLWNGGEIKVSDDNKYIISNWSDTPEKDGEMSLLIADYWYQSGITNGTKTPTFVLDNNKKSYRATLLLRSPNYRYQTLWKNIDAYNNYDEIKLDCDPDTNTCGGYNDRDNKKALAPISVAINDGKYGYFNQDQRFDFDKDLTPQVIYVSVKQANGENQTVSSIVFHGLNVKDYEGQKVSISYITNDVDTFSTLPSQKWTNVAEFKLTKDKYYYVTGLNFAPKWIKIEVSGKATFNFLSELSLYK